MRAIPYRVSPGEVDDDEDEDDDNDGGGGLVQGIVYARKKAKQ